MLFQYLNNRTPAQKGSWIEDIAEMEGEKNGRSLYIPNETGWNALISRYENDEWNTR